MITADRARRAKTRLMKSKRFQKLQEEGKVNGIGIGWVKNEFGKVPVHQQDDYCIIVMLREKISDANQFPESYYGVRIKTRVTSAIKARNAGVPKPPDSTQKSQKGK